MPLASQTRVGPFEVLELLGAGGMGEVYRASETQRWADTFERELSGVLALQSDVAREVARRVDVALTPDQERRLAGARSVNPEVDESSLRGMYHVAQNTPESFEKGMRYLHRAVELDPAEPLAYAGLAAGYITLGHGGASDQPDAFPRARAAAEQALKLQPDMPEAVGFLADVALYYEWDWARAEALFERALALAGHRDQALGDRNAAIEELEAAHKAHTPTLPWVRVRGGDFDTLRDDPRFQDPLRRMVLPQ